MIKIFVFNCLVKKKNFPTKLYGCIIYDTYIIYFSTYINILILRRVYCLMFSNCLVFTNQLELIITSYIICFINNLYDYKYIYHVLVVSCIGTWINY